jgi:hypothetical protein
MTATHDIGDRRKLTCEVRDEDGALVDPTALVFTMKTPDATVTSYEYLTDVEVVRDSLGLFHVYWDCAAAGKHYWRFAATGNVGAAEESTFTVRASKVLP